MATFYAPSAKDPSALRGPSALFVSAPVRSILGNFAFTTAMLIADQIVIGKIPSSAILLPQSTIVHAALGAGVQINAGFITGGGSKATALGSALDVAAAGTKAGLAAVTTANLGKRVWEIAGHTSDPKTEMELVWAIAGANVGAAGAVFYNYLFASGT